MLNGMLTGIIAQCAGCDRYIPTFSAVIGVIGGLVYLLGHKFMVLLKLDDPLDAVAVHAGGGQLERRWKIAILKSNMTFG